VANTSFLLLMPSYNQVDYIGEAVESCLAQDDPDWELWILDNSTDGTPEVMRRFRDERIRFIHDPVRSDPGSCLNRLLTMARGDDFSYVHTDNRLRPGYVRAFRSALRSHPLALAYCDYFQVNAEGRNPRLRRRLGAIPPEQLFSSNSLGVPFAATTALAERVGGFSSDDLADDVLFVMQADSLGPRIHVPQALLDYRVHDRSRGHQSGADDVGWAMYCSALKAYGLRRADAPDPFLGMEARIRTHVDRASRTARVLARALLARVTAGAPVWIEGAGPASFWLAWACAEQGRPAAGFRVAQPARSGQTLLGLPVTGIDVPLPTGQASLRPRRVGLEATSVRRDWLQPLRWLAHGLPPRDHRLKYYPASEMSSLLIPLHHRSPGTEPVWIRGSGALAAYLAFGVESLARLTLAGWISSSPVFPGGCPTLRSAPEKARVWKTPGESGEGVEWAVPRSRDQSSSSRRKTSAAV